MPSLYEFRQGFITGLITGILLGATALALVGLLVESY